MCMFCLCFILLYFVNEFLLYYLLLVIYLQQLYSETYVQRLLSG